MKKEEIIFLNQLVQTLEESAVKLEEAYEDKDINQFNKVKRFMIEIQRKISEVVK